MVTEYIDDESGIKLERPALDQLRQAVSQEEFDVVICYDLDRFGRNLGHQILLEQEFARHNVSIHYVLGEYKENPEGRLTKHIKAVIAEYEREKILERTRRGRIGRAKAGQVNVGYRRPYGYIYRGGKHTGQLEIVPEEARVVRDIYRWYVEDGLSLYKIAIRLSDLRIPTVCDQTGRTGADKEKTRAGYGQWCRASVANILKNEVYAGTWYDCKYKYISKTRRIAQPKEEWIPVPVTPIIPRELWETAQARLTNHRRYNRRAKRKYLLSGLLRCTSCGNRYVGQSMVGNAGRTTYYYYTCHGTCTEYKDKRCREPKINAVEADQLVWEKIAEGLREPQLLAQQYATWRKGHPQRVEEASIRLAQVKASLNQLGRQRDRWLELFVDGEVDRKQHKEKQDEIRVRQRGLEQERQALDTILCDAENIEPRLRAFEEFCSTVSHRLNDLTFEEKQKLLRLLDIQGTVREGQLFLSGCIPTWQKQEEMFAHRPFEPDQLP